ncbi:hypothetical protein B0H14DRAFT_2701975 [Mycena olivaceomarginata]|nr:hypothetical protein B0H14DRAFT_2701975 [Mycena olivaceomarginata]
MSPYNLSACPHRACPPLVLRGRIYHMSSARNTRGNRFARTSIRRIPLRSLTVPPSSLSPCHSDIALTDSVLAVAETISLGRPIPVHGVCPDPPPRLAPSPRIPRRRRRSRVADIARRPHPLLSFYNDAGGPRPIARGPRHPIHEVLPSTSPTFARPQQRVYAIA